MVGLVTLLLTGAAIGYSIIQTPVYEASVLILVGQNQDTMNPSSLGGDVQGLQQLTQTVAVAVSSRPIAEAVIQQLDLAVSPERFLKDKVRAQQVPDTQFIRVTYKDASPERAQRVANAIGEVFSERISYVSPAANAVTATVWEPAALPTYPVTPNFVLNTFLALVLGVTLGVGLAFLLEYLDDSWRSPEEVEQISGVPVYGVVPQFKELKSGKGA